MPQNDSGLYILVMDLKKKHVLNVGKLGRAMFLAGKYLYVGRAKRYLRGRLARHLRREKKEGLEDMKREYQIIGRALTETTGEHHETNVGFLQKDS